ncbi:hypothetical protein F5X68DRAFT_40884 [Plectosphaerella plurivora]|uniref:HTH APSES-type domain-containing protein n=1 Tax=Plectosphaerella plurivora TaxID=936078 RepID=A0A9P8V4E1_9PEZI|nr:hypothetical protein F5X68DRAFT_40884 [Plectosphaerella plurivora]
MMPATVTPSIEIRALPAKRNPLMVDDVPQYKDLVSRRRLGQTQLTPKMVNQPEGGETASLGVFDYAHLRAPLPKGIVSGIFKSSPNSYFLMRRSHDGYVSATGMFKATFPYAEAHEEETERKFIKSLESTSPEETAGNVWISPEHALKLADEYDIVPWIQALLDPAPIAVSSNQDSPAKKIAAPPKFGGMSFRKAPPTPTSLPRSTRTLRSASPTKLPAPRPVKTPRKRKAKSESVDLGPSAAAAIATKVEINGTIDENEVSEAVTEATVKLVEAEPAAILEDVEEEQKVKVLVEQDVKVDEEGHEVKHTAIALELPLSSSQPPTAEETARMLAEAKAMVEAANGAPKEEDEEASAKPKRKADDITAVDEDGQVAESEERSSKRTRPNVQLKKERVRNRALLGLSATVALGALSTYLMGVF